jgi:hypothetical protein
VLEHRPKPSVSHLQYVYIIIFTACKRTLNENVYMAKFLFHLFTECTFNSRYKLKGKKKGKSPNSKLAECTFIYRVYIYLQSN